MPKPIPEHTWTTLYTVRHPVLGLLAVQKSSDDWTRTVVLRGTIR